MQLVQIVDRHCPQTGHLHLLHSVTVRFRLQLALTAHVTRFASLFVTTVAGIDSEYESRAAQVCRTCSDCVKKLSPWHGDTGLLAENNPGINGCQVENIEENG